MRHERVLSAVSRRALPAFAAIVFAAAGLAALADDAKDDALKKLQGTWVNAKAGEDRQSRWSFDKDGLKATVGASDYAGKVTLDPKGEPFPTIDVAVSEGSGDNAGKTSKGIYKFDGDRLVICVASPGGATRPSEFKEVEGEFYLFELAKEK